MKNSKLEISNDGQKKSKIQINKISNQSQKSKNKQKNKNNFPNSKIKIYFCSWLYFLVGFTIFILIWITGRFSIFRLTSYYYLNSYNVSPYSSTQAWISFRQMIEPIYINSNQFYSSENLKKADSIVQSLLFSWIIWKLPLSIYTFNIIQIKKQLHFHKYQTYGFYILLELIFDILMTTLAPEIYSDWIFFLFYAGLSIILIIICYFKRTQKLIKNIKNFILPIAYLAAIYASYCLLIPLIYRAIYNSSGSSTVYIFVYIFSIFDLIFYSLIVSISYFCSPKSINFVKMLYFLNTGYAVGNSILFSPEEIEFYYLMGYFVIRNIVFNWIAQKTQKYVTIPTSEPGWIIIYLVSLCVNFIPLIGFGNLVISKSFYSQILQITVPILSYNTLSEFQLYEISKLLIVQKFNPSLKSNIGLTSVFIVWIILAITQKYHIGPLQKKELAYYIFGIYLFYFGLSSGLQILILQSNIY